jgi:nicotinate-nucleotide adenylyltransferase
MTRLSIEGNDDFEVSDIELRRDGVSYTVDTIREISTQNPQDELFLIVGGDSLRTFHMWRDPAGILALAKLVVFGRDRDQYPDVDPDVFESTTVIPNTPLIGVSSSRIRKMIASEMSIRYLVPDVVAAYIRTNRLYGPDG